MTKGFHKNMDDDALMRELHKLEDMDDDLFLDDVGAVGPNRGGKFPKRRDVRQRGFGRGKPSRGRMSHKEDIFDIGPPDIGNYDKWNMEHRKVNDVDFSMDIEEFETRTGGFRGRGRARGGPNKRDLKQPFRGRAGKNPMSTLTRGFIDSRMSDTFDIESKPQRGEGDKSSFDRNAEHGSSWNREVRDSPGYGVNPEDADRKETQSPRFVQHRVDPRLVGKTEYDSRFGLYKRNDPRVATQRSDAPAPSSERAYGQSRIQQPIRNRDGQDGGSYESSVKDPRVTSQQVDKNRGKIKEDIFSKDRNEREIPFVPVKVDLKNPSKGPDHIRKFENRFIPVGEDPRLAAKKNYGSNNLEKTIFEKISSNPALLENQIPGIADALKPPEPKKSSQHVRRGPRSPSPVPPSSPVSKKERNGSPAPSRKREAEKSPVRIRSRWERSVSPVHNRGERSASPRKRSKHKERSVSLEHHIERSVSREHHKERSVSRERRKERSMSRERRKERSMSRERRMERSMSRERHKEHSHERREWSGSPHRKNTRRDRSSSPRRRRRSRSASRGHSNERSHDRSRDRSYGRSPDRSHEKSSSRHSPSPRPVPHRSSVTSARDLETPWSLEPQPLIHVGGPPRYPVPQPSGYEMHPPAMYAEPYRPPAPNYGPPQPAGGPPPPGYGVPYQQQHYHYDGYGYPQPTYPEYQQAPAPPPGSWGPDRNVMYPDMSQPPPPSQVPTQPPQPTAPPPTAPAPPPQVDPKAEEAKKEAIKNEVLQQKQTLSKQREEYVRKSTMISRELQLLRNQEEELVAEKSRDNDRILRENHKLQLEIQNKLKAINNVIDMLTGIIGDKKEMEEQKQRAKKDSKAEKKHPKTPPETPPKSSSESPDHAGTKAVEPPVPGEGADLLPVPVPALGLHGGSSGTVSMAAVAATAATSEDKKPIFNYVHYDPEMHWCRVCDVFPRTAKEFLNHLHSTEHKDVTLERKLVDMPWHKAQTEEEVTYTKGAPTKRTPIRGLQFFISATAWYCKLCDTWIGDLHCASLHLKSKIHTEKYVNFTEQNPHWETDWLADREKAYERKSDERRQLRDTPQDATAPLSQTTPPILQIKEEKPKKSKKERKKDRKVKEEKDGKKKKRKKKSKKKIKTFSGTESSSSTSTSTSSEEGSEGEDDKGKSIRVAMRNKIKALEGQSIEKELPSAYSLKTAGGWQSLEMKEEASRLLELERLEKERALKEEREKFDREKSEYERYERERLEKEEREAKLRRLPPKEDKMLREWMGSSKEPVSEGERQILSSIKDRVKMKQEEEKTRKRDERDRYYEKGHYEEGYRRRRRGDSPENRGGKRGRSRSPDERRWDRSKPDKYKRSPQRSAASASRFRDVREGSPEKKGDGDKDKKNSAKVPEVTEQEEAETKFEKQAAEAAARLKKKDKKPLITNIPKSKLPFIGRMPIMKHLAKKKGDDEGGDKGTKPSNEMKKLPIIGPALPPGMAAIRLGLKPVARLEDQGAGAVVQDMDIDDEDSNGATATVVEEQVPIAQPPLPVTAEPSALYAGIDIPPDKAREPPETLAVGDIQHPPEVEVEPAEVTDAVVNPRAKKSTSDIPLPKDFQEALNILFPGEKKPSEEPKPEPENESPPEHQWNQDMMGTGPHQMPGYGQMMGMHPMYPNMGPQGMNGPPGFHQGMMGPQDMPPHGMMGPQDGPPHGMMGPQNMPHGMMGGPQDGPPHGMMGPQDRPPHGMMMGPRDMPPHGMMGGPHDMPPHGMMGGPQDRPPHGMMGPHDRPPHGMMGGPQDRPPHGMMGPQNMPPHGMMGGPQNMPPHGMMGGPQDRPPHGMMGGPQDRPPHGMMGGPQDRHSHGMMGGPHDRPPHGMMGGPQDRPPQGRMAPQDRPPHGKDPEPPKQPPLPPPARKRSASDSEHSDEEGDKGKWCEDDLAMLGMDAADMAAQNF